MKADAIASLLPEVFRATLKPREPLHALLQAMEALHDPVEHTLGELGSRFDPRRAPDRFVPLLARWVGLEDLLPRSAAAGPVHRRGDPRRKCTHPVSDEALPTGTGRLRELVARAAELSRWRGTARGLTAFLETATGLSGFVVLTQAVDSVGQPRPFHIQVEAPAAARCVAELIERIIELEKPAATTHEVVFVEADAAKLEPEQPPDDAAPPDDAPHPSPAPES